MNAAGTGVGTNGRGNPIDKIRSKDMDRRIRADVTSRVGPLPELRPEGHDVAVWSGQSTYVFCAVAKDVVSNKLKTYSFGL